MHAGAGWVGDDHIRSPVCFQEFVVEEVLDIAGVEVRVIDVVQNRVALRILNRIRYVFESDDLSRLSRDEIRDRTRTCIEVVDQLIFLDCRHLRRHPIQVICLLRVRLVKGLRTHSVLQVPGTVGSWHDLRDVGISLPADNIEVVKRIVLFAIDHILKRCDLREIALETAENLFNPFHLVIRYLEDDHDFVRRSFSEGGHAIVRRSDRERSQEADLFSEIEEWNVVPDSFVFRRQANTV